MKPRLKPIRDQVIVITGASSGIGLATAYAAAGKGARVVLAARNGAVLQRVAADIRAQGGDALPVTADISRREDVDAIAAAAIAAHGGFDTWVNNAGVGIFGRLDQVSEAEHRRVFDVNYWGLVHGSMVAVRHLRVNGGVLVNLGSVLSEVTVPLQGPYAASKAAVRGFTDTLRHELLAEGAPVCISLIKPAAIDTPFPQHARNHTPYEPRLPPPLYPPEEVAAAILKAAEEGGRDYPVGRAAPAILAAGRLAPGLVDVAAAWFGPALQRRRSPPTSPVEGNLYTPMGDGDMHAAPPPDEPPDAPHPGAAPVKPVPLAALAILLAAGIASVVSRRG
jgi:NAD(P)-dependent dehydrogenase (short-subunit alcohol dehydrogenase family)